MYAIKINGMFVGRETKVNRYGELVELNRYKLTTSPLMAVKYENEDQAKTDLDKFKSYLATIVKINKG